MKATRRNFLETAGLAAAGWMIVKPELVRGTQANSAITVGVIGPGRRGTSDAAIMMRNPNARVVALCDIYEDQIKEAQKRLTLENPRIHKDYQSLLSSDVDAVLIATPPYQHPEQFEAAVQAKKHIFQEKPVGVDAAGCKRFAAAARKADSTRDIVVDFQQRYGPGYLEAYNRVHRGDVGKINMIRTTWMVGDLPRRKGNWSQEEEKVRNWLFYRDRSGDIIVEQHVHSLDVANWFLGAHPIRATGGAGGRLKRTDIGDIMDHLSVTFEYPGGVLLSHSGNQFSMRLSRVVEEFWGAKGGVELSRAKVTVFDPNLGNWSLDARQDITIDTVDKFFERIRSGKVENIGVAAAESTLTGIMGLRAILERREVKWEEVTGV